MPCILVVEDDAEVREVVCEFLRDSGHTVLSAGSAQRARDLLARETVDLLIIDCVMSGEQGGSLAEHAKILGVPAILTSGDLRYRETIPQSTVPFLTKPFRLRELGELISRTMTVLPPSGAGSGALQNDPSAGRGPQRDVAAEIGEPGAVEQH